MNRTTLHTKRSLIRRMLSSVLTIGLVLSAPAIAAAQLVLGTNGGAFTVNGEQRFLVFVSYFDALDTGSFQRVGDATTWGDFQRLRDHGVDGIRIFANWWGMTEWNSQYHYAQDTLVKDDGTLRSTRINKFLQVLDDAKAYGLVVDVVFSAENVKYCASTCYKTTGSTGTLTRAEHSNSIQAVASLLAGYGTRFRHVMFDIHNEGNHVGPSDGDLATSATDYSRVLAIRNAVKAIDPLRVVTFSTSSAWSASTAANFAEGANLDGSNWHGPRINDVFNNTASSVPAMRTAFPNHPAYLSETMPSMSGWNIDPDWSLGDIQQDLRTAKEKGAAAWCFHSKASFFLHRSRSLYQALATPEFVHENDFLPNLRDVLDSVSWGL